MTLLIADISSHNPITSWPAFLASVDGLIVKISEGIGYAWSGAPAALAQARNAGKCVGAYHFARVNDPVAEADYFLAHYDHRPGEVIVLDWEPGTSVPVVPDDWAYAWCRRVIAATGVVPMVYLNEFYATRQSQWPKTRSLGCGLWAAWYGANTGQPLPGMPSFAPWPAPAMWQYTSNGTRPGVSGALDLNQFYGSADQWRAFGKGVAPAPTVQEDDMRLIRNADTGGVYLVGEFSVTPVPDPATWDALTAAGFPNSQVTGAQFAVVEAQAQAARKALLADVQSYVLGKNPGDTDQPWLFDRLVEIDGKVGQAQTPTLDEAKLAAALLADPNSVAALGKAIADNLQLSPRSA